MAEGRGYFTVVNPAAGGGRCGRRAPAALARLRGGGLTLEVRHTSSPGEASALAARAWDDGWRRFLAVGGDGTSYEIVNGLFSTDTEPARVDPREGPRPVLAMLPLGTGNSFLRDFDVDGPEPALRAIERGRTRPCDLVRVVHAAGELHYLNLLSLGFSAEAGSLTNRRFKPLGPAGYVAAVLVTAARYRSQRFRVAVDGAAPDARPCTLLSFSNSRYTAGTMMMAPHADVGDGEVDVIRIGAMPRLRFVRSFPSIFQGRHVERPEVEEGRARRVELDFDAPVDVMIDGEIQRLELERLEVVPSALEVVA